ncbi:DNA/RNA non-specific endonuclease [Larkinella terrae]|uniref:Uncharacterized protein n=1 Tax=Larkinella terrae TaxID=2025311 RepID=A0A7K0EWV9_9BACT|nr:DNA/RNA non-specific endonuclease [Larkinella terrae]MRS65768.1 hypothetical protein [Larkinella terrae]
MNRKVIVALPVGSEDLIRITAQTRVIGDWISNPNAASEQSWSNYRVSVDDIESKTGYDLLANVSDAVESVIEKQTDKVTVQAVDLYLDL